MKKLMTLLLLAPQLAFADPGIMIYSFGNTMMAFVEVDGLVVNKACRDKECEAFKKGKAFADADLPPGLLTGGKNPRSVRCTALMGGKVVIGLDRKRNEQSFCRFDDDSLLR